MLTCYLFAFHQWSLAYFHMMMVMMMTFYLRHFDEEIQFVRFVLLSEKRSTASINVHLDFCTINANETYWMVLAAFTVHKLLEMLNLLFKNTQHNLNLNHSCHRYILGHVKNDNKYVAADVAGVGTRGKNFFSTSLVDVSQMWQLTLQQARKREKEEVKYK